MKFRAEVIIATGQVKLYMNLVEKRHRKPVEAERAFTLLESGAF